MTTSAYLRHQRNWVGAFVLLMLGVFLLALFRAERVREWISPGGEIKVVLPEDGLFGLSEGASVEILGTPSGEVRRVVIDPDQKIHANVYVQRSMLPFVRRDSEAFIRKRFGVAGESYLEITRGRGAEIDWEYAVLTAQVERAPTETVGELLQDVRDKVFPILDDAQQAVAALALLMQGLQDPAGGLQQMLVSLGSITSKIERGEGALGRLMADDQVARELEQLLSGANDAVSRLSPILEELHGTAREMTVLSQSLAEQSGEIPKVTQNASAALASLDAILVDLRKTTPELPRITRNVSDMADSMPLLLSQTQQTMVELERLLRQLRSSWLLGGGSAAPAAGGAARIPPGQVRP